MGAMTRPTYDLEDLLRMSIHEVRAKRLERETMSTAIQKAVDEPVALAKAQPSELGIPIDQLVARVHKVREVQARVMQEGRHYGNVPGTDKPALLKPGAELLGLTFQLDPQFSSAERWDGEHLETVITCTLYHAPTGARLGSGIGSCSTREKKYAWRNGERVCPQCGKPAIIRGKEEYGGGWVCFKKKDGCNAKFKAGDKAIEGQQIGRVPNPDLADQYNTVRKMACKRAHVAAILFVTCASEIFTQDVEEGEAFDSPARHQDEPMHEPPKQSAEFDAVKKTLTETLTAIEKKNPIVWEDLIEWRLRIGEKGKSGSSEIARRMGALFAGDDITADQRKELSRLWNSVDKQIKRYEGIVPRPSDDDVDLEPGANG